jgi:small subunit ribosomal protein S18
LQNSHFRVNPFSGEIMSDELNTTTRENERENETTATQTVEAVGTETAAEASSETSAETAVDAAPEAAVETAVETAEPTTPATGVREQPVADSYDDSDDDAGEDDEDDYDDYDEAEEDDSHYVAGPAEYVQREKGGRARRIGSDIRVSDIDYKNIPMLSRFLDRRGRILSRRKTKVSAKVQRSIVKAIKRARHMALLPYTGDHTRVVQKRGR